MREDQGEPQPQSGEHHQPSMPDRGGPQSGRPTQEPPGDRRAVERTDVPSEGEPPEQRLPENHDDRPSGESSSRQEARHPDVPEIDDPGMRAKLAEAKKQGLSIHQMDTDLKKWMAEHYKVYTVTTPEHMTVKEFLAVKEQERVENEIVKNAYDAFDLFPRSAFAEARAYGELGQALISAFSAVSAIHADQLEKGEIQVGRKKHSVVTAKKMEFTVRNIDQADKLTSALHFLFQGNTIRSDGMKVWIEDFDEYRSREGARAVEALLAVESKRKSWGDPSSLVVRWPAKKDSLVNWQEEGETFPPGVEEDLKAKDRKYQDLALSSSTGGRIKKNTNILGGETAVAFAGMRDLFNSALDPEEKGNRDPQHPVVEKRIFYKKRLYRDPHKPEDADRRPAALRAPNARERAAAGVATVAQGTRDQGIRGAIDGAVKVAEGIPMPSLDLKFPLHLVKYTVNGYFFARGETGVFLESKRNNRAAEKAKKRMYELAA